jgi:hypothetical protein
MYFEADIATQIAKDTTKRAARQAAMNWRFRHLKSRETKIALAALTSVLGLFIR